MAQIRHAGKFIIQLPTAIEQVLKIVQFTALAPPTRDATDHQDDHQAECEEDEAPEEESQGQPAPPGPPPPWNPRESPSAAAQAECSMQFRKSKGHLLLVCPRRNGMVGRLKLDHPCRCGTVQNVTFW